MGRWSRRRAVGALGMVAVAMLWPRVSAAADLEVKLVLSQPRAEVGQGLHLEVEVAATGSGRVDLPEPTLPDVLTQGDAFVVQGPQVSTGFYSSNLGGQLESKTSKTFTYIVMPRRPGRFELSAVVAGPQGDVRSNVAVLEISGDAADPRPVRQVGKPTSAPGDLFLWATVDKPRAYVGEQITYQLDVYERSARMRVNLRKLPSFEDFWSVELPEGTPTQERVGNVAFRVHPGLHRALFPQKAGALRIGPADAAVDRRPSVFFGLRSNEAPRHISSTALEVEVLPLPAKGQPTGFSANNVGRYAIKAEVDRTEVEQGQPFSLTVTIEGEGNLKFLDVGSWPELDGARRYDPKEETELFSSVVVGGRRSFRFLVIPQRSGPLTIPPHALSFFDPQTERYETVATEPIELVVEQGSGAAPAAGADVADEAPGSHDDEDELAPLFVADNLPRHQRTQPLLSPRGWLYAMLGPPAVTGVLAGAGLLWRRLGPGEQARRLAARRAHRRERLDAARNLVESGEGFHGLLASVLQDAALGGAGDGGVGRPRPELLSLLEQRGVPAKDVARLRELMDRCDMARFAAQAEEAHERRKLLDDVEELVQRPSIDRAQVSP